MRVEGLIVRNGMDLVIITNQGEFDMTSLDKEKLRFSDPAIVETIFNMISAYSNTVEKSVELL